jgi:hypothetical protein
VADAWAHATSPARISPRHYRVAAKAVGRVPRAADASAVRAFLVRKTAAPRLPMPETIARDVAMAAAGKAVTGRNHEIIAILEVSH